MTIWAGKNATQDKNQPLHIEFLNDRAAIRRRLVGKERIVEGITDALHNLDPVRLGTGDPQEYRAEAETITLSLPERLTVDALQTVVHQEFVHWFDADMAGPRERYLDAANAVADVLRSNGITVLINPSQPATAYEARHVPGTSAPHPDVPSQPGVTDIRDIRGQAS